MRVCDARHGTTRPKLSLPACPYTLATTTPTNTQSGLSGTTDGSGSGMATARASRRLAPGGDAHATPAVGPASSGGQRSPFNLSSGAATAVVFVSILLCFILLCTYCRCARQRAIAGARRRVMRDLVPGVSSLFLRPAAAALPPVLPYDAAAGAKKGLPEDCPICLEPFRDGDGVRVVPACGHLYHAPCIDRWLDVRNSCPVCRCAVASLYAAADRERDTAAAVADGADHADDQEAVLQRLATMIQAIRDEQREDDAVAQRAPAAGGGGGGS